MPYSLKGNSVVKSDSGQVVKTHPTREKALAHLRALKANVEEGSSAVLGSLLEAFDAAKHPRGFGGKFTDALHKLDDYASAGKSHVGSDSVRQALTNVAVAQHLHAGGDERGAYGRLKLAHQKLGAGGGGTEIGNQRGRAARLAVIGLMRHYESTPGTPRPDLKSAKVAGAADVVRYHRSAGREGKPAARIREAEVQERPEVLGALLERDFSADRRRQLAKTGAAMSDGSFPVVNGGDLDSAIKLARTPAQRAHVKKRAKAIGQVGKIPAGWG